MDVRYPLLHFIADHGGVCSFTDAMNVTEKFEDTFWLLQSCIKEGYVRGDVVSHSTMELTPKGRAALLQMSAELAENEAKDKADRKKHASNSRKDFTYGFIFVIFAWLLDQFTGVFTDLFHKIFG